MASSVRTTVTRTDYDSNGIELNTYTYVIASSYTNLNCGMIVLTSGNAWKTISIGDIVKTTYIEFISNQPVSLRWTTINGTEFKQDNVENVIMTGNINSFDIQNTSGEDATIEYRIYGDRVEDLV